MTASEATISSVNAAALYGKGIFTTVAIYDRKPFLWEKHWQRLCNNAEKVTVDLSEYSEETTRIVLDEIVKINGVTNGRMRLTFFDETSSKIWPSNVRQKTSLLITTGDLRPIPDNFRLTISPYPVNSQTPLAGIKSCNYLEKLLTSDEANNRGFYEAIQVNERGEITSAAMANLFWLKGNTLYTPSLKTGCLPGTTREFILENIECREVKETIDELKSADAIFLTSAGLGVVQVGEFESRKLAPVDHAILDLLPKRSEPRKNTK